MCWLGPAGLLTWLSTEDSFFFPQPSCLWDLRHGDCMAPLCPCGYLRFPYFKVVHLMVFGNIFSGLFSIEWVFQKIQEKVARQQGTECTFGTSFVPYLSSKSLRPTQVQSEEKHRLHTLWGNEMWVYGRKQLIINILGINYHTDMLNPFACFFVCEYKERWIG